MEKNNEKDVNYLDKIVDYIDLESLCELIKVLAGLSWNVPEINDQHFTIGKSDKSDNGIKISNAEKSKAWYINFNGSGVEIIIMVSDTSYIIMYGAVFDHTSIEDLTEENLKELSRKYVSEKANEAGGMGYRIINYLGYKALDNDEEIYRILELFRTNDIESKLFSSDDLQDIISYLDSSYHDDGKRQGLRGAFRKCNRKRLITS